MTHIPTQHEVETFTGQFVDTRDPQADTICLPDIAHALSNICRYGGHSSRFYSVAEHAVAVSKRLERKGYDVDACLAGLHHDDAEAYLGDIPRPLKPLLGHTYATLTAVMDNTIVQALRLPFGPEAFHSEAVKEADNWLLFVEARHFLPSQGRSWDAHAEGRTWSAGQPSRIVTPDYWHDGLVPEDAELLFLNRHSELVG